MLQDNLIDDFLAYCPQYKETVEKIKSQIHALAATMELEYHLYSQHAKDSKAFALAGAADSWCSGFLFSKRTNQKLRAIDYILNLPARKIKELLTDG